jgi:hypothetical protein
MRVTFLGSAAFKLASYRYRILMPCKEMMAQGVDCQIVTSYDGLNADVFVFSKHWHPDKDQAAVTQIQAPGFMAANQVSVVADDRPDPKVVYDVCDDHFDHPKYGPHYHFMCQKADLIIASTDRMQEIIKEKTGLDSTVINDPFEYPELKVRHKWEQWDARKILWYGHASNFEHLHRVWDDLRGYQLMAITDGITLEDTVADQPFPVVSWSHENMMDGFRQADIVVIPNEGELSPKGANRMIEAIRQGVFVVAEPQPEYNKFKEWMYIGDIGKGLEWVQSNKKCIRERIEQAQKFVSSKYHPQTIGKMWTSALSSTWGVEHKNGQAGSTSMPLTEVEQTAQILPQT